MTEIKAHAVEGSGLPFGIAAYGMWGLLPIYFKLLSDVEPLELVSSRVLFSLIFMGVVLTATGALREFGRTLRHRATMIAMTGSATLIAINWLTYIWAVNGGHVVGASLGYFLNPLINVLLGVLVLKEKLRRAQMAAIFVAALGVIVMAASALQTLWVSLVLALSFAFYGLIRKTADVGPRQGLAAETLILTPIAGCYMIWLASNSTMTFGIDAGTSTLLALSGIITSVPLLLFATAARRLPLTTLGLLQYIAPTLQFIIGILYGETLSGGQMVSFGLIWAGLVLFTVDSVGNLRRARAIDLQNPTSSVTAPIR
ncbi:EamA family transporter RarD [Sphingobium sp. SCG-1]|uniref:EamA family transporter RarD n=1 Tax=Sphingobium sp. SCG-1 TaxID=2072936 RepID=UPI000CD6B19E|nr:EamA family transporter RarD [Sphingobium sp. SCG-1]AUW56860.1 EamA family transporter RarD [Sphingobium sp. SCG-1]